MFVFRKGYLICAAILFLVEIFIALYINDAVIRPYGGDFLVVIFLYCLIKTFLNVSILQAIMVVLIFSIFIEVLQLFPVLDMLNIKNSSVLAIALGSTFEWKDILLYIVGCSTILGVEKWRSAHRSQIALSFLSR